MYVLNLLFKIIIVKLMYLLNYNTKHTFNILVQIKVNEFNLDWTERPE